MATVVTICNLALSRIGDSATISSISPPDKSAQAEACSRLYPVALATCLDMHNWSFATRRAELSELADSMVSKGPWLHAFGLPSDCHRVIDIQPSIPKEDEEHHHIHHFRPPPTIDFKFETVGTEFGGVLLANICKPELRYVCSEPKPSQFSGLFTDALSWLLAAYLAGETIRGDSAFNYHQNCMKQFQMVVASAIEKDARQTHAPFHHIPLWIRGR